MRSTALSLIIGGAVLAAACSGNNSPAAPSANSATAAAASVPASGGATISGTVVGMSTASRMRAMSAGMTVSVAGTSAMTSVDGSGRFVLQNVPAGTVTLRFTGTGVNAALTLPNVAANSTVTITVQVSGTTAQLDTNDDEGSDNEVEIEGTVTAVTSSTLTVAGKTITVTSSTKIVHGETTLKLSQISVGDRVHVQGTRSGTTITATKVEVQNGAATPGEGNDGENGARVELSGTISGRTGSCPAITFMISSTKVVTSSKTEFGDTSCSALVNGSVVQVEGTKQTDGSVMASSVELKNKD